MGDVVPFHHRLRYMYAEEMMYHHREFCKIAVKYAHLTGGAMTSDDVVTEYVRWWIEVSKKSGPIASETALKEDDWRAA